MPNENISNADLSRKVGVFLIDVPYYLYTWILIVFLFILFIILCGLLKRKKNVLYPAFYCIKLLHMLEHCR